MNGLRNRTCNRDPLTGARYRRPERVWTTCIFLVPLRLWGGRRLRQSTRDRVGLGRRQIP